MVALIRQIIQLDDGTEIGPDNNTRIMAMDWQVADNETFRNPILKSMDDTVNLSTIVFKDILDPNIKWFARARALIKDSGWTKWGNLDVLRYEQVAETETTVNVMPSRVATPIITTNSNPMYHDATLFTITASGYSVIGNATHVATSWFVEDLDGNVVWDSNFNTLDKETIQFRNMVLKSGRVYRIRCMFHSSSNDVSSIGCRTIKISDSNDLELLTYLDDVDYNTPTEIQLAQVVENVNVTGVTWQIISLTNNYAEVIYNNVTTGINMLKCTIPANILKDDTMYLLKFKANIENESVDQWKYIHFKTLNESQTFTQLSIEPSSLNLIAGDEANLTITTNANDYNFRLEKEGVITYEKLDNKISAISRGSCVIYITATAPGKRATTKEVIVNVESDRPILTIQPTDYTVETNNSIEITIAEISDGATLSWSNPTSGTLTYADGTLTYTANDNIDVETQDVITFKSNKDTKESDPVEVTITITPPVVAQP